MCRFVPAVAASVLLAGCAEQTAEPRISEAELIQAVEQARRDRVAELRKPSGWLTLVGLYFLNEGENPFGSGTGNVVVLPAGKAPERAGIFVLNGGKVTVRVEQGVDIQVDGQAITKMELVDDAGGNREPTAMTHGSLRFFPVVRGGMVAIRVTDSESETRTEFAGLEYFPISAEWAIEAQFERLDEARHEPIENSIGQDVETPVAGLFHFENDGNPHTLELTAEGTVHYIVLGDATNGGSTYAGGRFLRIGDLPPDGPYLLNFNLAYNPPCVFTPYATCPRPTKQNRLPIAVEAGEKMYAQTH
jgi:hypothetical protein